MRARARQDPVKLRVRSVVPGGRPSAPRGFAGYPSDRTIGRRFADQGGWLAALEHAELIVPPAMTVRMMTRSTEEATELETAARAAGFVAAKARKSNWIEVRATLPEVRRAIADDPSSFVEALTLWEPATKTLEHVKGKGNTPPA